MGQDNKSYGFYELTEDLPKGTKLAVRGSKIVVVKTPEGRETRPFEKILNLVNVLKTKKIA